MGAIQRALAVIYPHLCLLCDTQVGEAGALCPECWAETPFLSGHLCYSCAAPLIGEGDGARDQCDECLATPRAWDEARAVFAYSGAGRRAVLKLKHSDRTDLAGPAASWMARAGRDVLADTPLLVPAPLHWTRRIRRRYNQSAEIARALARQTGCQACPDALIRTRVTAPHKDMNTETRRTNQSGSMQVNARQSAMIAGRSVLIIDDVMTTGATVEEASRALYAAGATRISCLVLARAVRNP